MNKPAIVGFVLIILLVASFVTPAVSKQITIDKENMLESNPEQGDSKLLATLRMDFGEEIYNDKIKWYTKFKNPPRNYHIDLNINFECPSNRKIYVNYYVGAKLFSHVSDIVFFDFSDSVTIINGSNPTDIDESYEKHVYPEKWTMFLKIEATLKVYEYVDGDWVKVNEDDTLDEKWISFWVAKSRGIGITYPFMNLIERFPNMFPMLRHLWRL
jgi:hypothetical protein